MSGDRPRICVYCASRMGADPEFEAAARRTGDEIGRRGADVVFGGGHVGLMGVMADAAMAAGSHVLGVIPGDLVNREVAHDGLSELVVVADMPARKRVMYEQADAFLTLPGGVGTMEEMFEVLCWRYLGLHAKPIGLLNVGGYYDALLSFVDSSIESGLWRQSALDLLAIGTDPAELVDRVLSMSGAELPL